MSLAKKIRLFACTSVVVGNTMGSSIALLPANPASIGGIAIWGWIISIISAMSLVYAYARLATRNPQQGDPITYAGEIFPASGSQTDVLYYHTDWIGNLAIGVTAVSYLSTFFLVLNNPVPVGIACIVIVWVFTFVNMLDGAWVSRLTTIDLVLVLIPVVMIAIVGWHWFDVAAYVASQNTADTTNGHAIVKNIPLYLWAFVSVESATVSISMVRSLRRTVPLATTLGTGLIGIAYIVATQVFPGTYPSSVMAAFDAPSAISASTTLDNWTAPLVSAFTAFVCLTSLDSWMMLVGQTGVRAANDGNFPKAYDEVGNSGTPRRGLLLIAVKMTALMILITLMNSADGRVPDLSGELTGIAVLLTMLPYFYSCVNLIRFEGVNIHNFVSPVCSVLGCVSCFIVLMGTSSPELAGTLIVSLIILMFYTRKAHERQSHSMDNHTASNAH